MWQWMCRWKFQRAKIIIRYETQMLQSFQHLPFFLLSFCLLYVSLGLIFQTLDGYFGSFFVFRTFLSTQAWLLKSFSWYLTDMAWALIHYSLPLSSLSCISDPTPPIDNNALKDRDSIVLISEPQYWIQCLPYIRTSTKFLQQYFK